jgi:hypothetical protein
MSNPDVDGLADGPRMPTQDELEAMFDADDADLASGLVVPAEPVLADMRSIAARIRRERTGEEATATQRG